jgi:hypothetical protein
LTLPGLELRPFCRLACRISLYRLDYLGSICCTQYTDNTVRKKQFLCKKSNILCFLGLCTVATEYEPPAGYGSNPMASKKPSRKTECLQHATEHGRSPVYNPVLCFSWLKHYAKAGRWRVLIPIEISGFLFNLPNLSSCTMALSFPEPLTEVSTRNILGT